MLKVLLTLILLAPGLTFAETCEIVSAEKVYHLGKDQIDQPIPYRSSTCSENINRSYHELLLNSSGAISAQRLSQMLFEQTQERVRLQPDRIQIYDLAEMIKDRFALASHWSVRQLTSLDRQAVLLNANQWLDLSCTQCQQTGEKNIQLMIRDSHTNQEQSRFLKGRIKVRVDALTSISNLRVSNENARTRDFHTTQIETDRPEELFTEVTHLNYYRLNRPLPEGVALKHSDLTPSNLVQPGTPSKVILKAGGLSLSTTAQPMKAGRFGEMIQLRNSQTQKMIVGKVIDFNTVEVTQ